MAKSWKERKEEEARILAEMDEAMQAQAAETQETQETQDAQETGKEKTSAPQKEEKRAHCPKCGNYMKDGVCPACGHRIYVPMDEGKQKTVRLIVGAVCIVAFLLLYFVFGK